MIVPSGTSSNRPKSTVAAGAIRFNTDTNQVEAFDGKGWLIVGEAPMIYSWERWFAWRPVKVHNKWKWLRTVYRKEIPKTYVDHDDWTRYEYGTIFDAIKDA